MMLSQWSLMALAAIGTAFWSACGEAPRATQTSAAGASTARAGASQGSSAEAVSPTGADWKAEWERVLAAAKREGQVTVMSATGDDRRKALVAFQQTYPDIQVEYTAAQRQDMGPKIIAERQGGRFLWDVCVCPGVRGLEDLGPAGAIDPLRPSLVRPEIWDDSRWLDGFAAGFMDRNGDKVYATVAYLNWDVFVNRDIIPDTELNKLEDLLDPRYKGRIAWEDPRTGTTGAYFAALFKQKLGPDALRKLLTEQGVVYTTDQRQLAEWVVRGRYAIGIGSDIELEAFRKEGLGKNVRHFDIPEATIQSTFQSVMVFNRPPHPNAAKVYLDWFLSKEGQTSWNKNLTYNSRRLDVEPADPKMVPKPGIKYFTVDREEEQVVRQEAVAIAKEVLR